MMADFFRSGAEVSCANHAVGWRVGWVLLALTLPACNDFGPRANLAPPYEPPPYVVP